MVNLQDPKNNNNNNKSANVQLILPIRTNLIEDTKQ